MTVGQIPAAGLPPPEFSRSPISSAPEAADTQSMSAPRPSTTAFRVVVVSLALVGLGALLWATPGAQASASFAPGRTHLDWWMLALLAGACEMVVLHIQVRREAHAISLSEIATVIGLFFATPTDFVVGRAVGTLLAFLLWRRQSLVKASFNASLFFAESALALLVFHSLRGTDLSVDPLAWLAAIAATVTASLLASLAVTTVIALVDGEVHRRDFLIEPARGALTSIFVTVLAWSGACADPQPAGRSTAGGGDGPAAAGLPGLQRAVRTAPQPGAALPVQPRGQQHPGGGRHPHRVLQHAREVLRAEYAR